MEKYNKDITAVIPVREGSTRLMNITVRQSRQSDVARATCPD